MRLAPPDDHDETLDAWRNALSGEELEALRSRRNELVRQARKSLRTG